MPHKLARSSLVIVRSLAEVLVVARESPGLALHRGVQRPPQFERNGVAQERALGLRLGVVRRHGLEPLGE